MQYEVHMVQLGNAVLLLFFLTNTKNIPIAHGRVEDQFKLEGFFLLHLTIPFETLQYNYQKHEHFG